MSLTTRRAWRHTVVFAVAALVVSPGQARADDTARINELERKLERSLKMIEELSAEVRELKAKQAAPAAPAGAVVPPGSAAPAAGAAAAGPSAVQQQQAAQIQELKQQVDSLTTSLAAPPSFDLGLPLHGFADVGFHAGNHSYATDHGFSVGSLDFYLTPQFGDRVKSLAELIFEVSDSTNPPSVQPDLERLQIGYTFSDDFTLWAGRFHTPYGYWNTAFHHGKQLMTTINRPQFIDFEDEHGILPAHSVGIWGSGSLRAGEGKIGYDLYLANGPKIDGAAGGTGIDATGTLDPSLARAPNHTYEWGGRLGYQFGGALDGLGLGVHYLDMVVNDDFVQPGNLPTDKTGVRVYGGYGTYVTDDWEILSEYYRFDNRDLSGSTGTHDSWAWYGQIGHPFGRYTPYYRLERTRLDQNDNYFAYLEGGYSYRRHIVGLRYDINPKVALKFEYWNNRIMDRAPIDDDQVRAQFAIRF